MAADQTKDAVTGIAGRLQRFVSDQVAKQASDANASTPRLEYNVATGERYYDTAPTPLKRLMTSPLAQRGPFAKGPASERLVLDGWSTSHMSLDFAGTSGESVFATADGTVTFVGYQSVDGVDIEVDKVRADATGVLFNAANNVVARPTDIGFRGIYVTIQHTGDFSMYTTSYARLSQASVTMGQKVTEGGVIGSVGGTGGSHGFSTENLYLLFESYFSNSTGQAVVPATSIVPNKWPGHMDSTNSIGLGTLITPLLAAAGVQVASGQGANLINSLNRATSLQNQSTSAIKQNHADFSARTSQNVNVQVSAAYAALTAFSGAAPVVATPMTFDFTAGTWSPDGGIT
jgi:murein DD-endopeptidase MepM/ murein hydrolase activator NlpD